MIKKEMFLWVMASAKLCIIKERELARPSDLRRQAASIREMVRT